MTNYENIRNKKQKKYIKKLKAENEKLKKIIQDERDMYSSEIVSLCSKLGISNGTVAKQIDHIAMLNRQLEQQDLYMNRYMEELAVLKRMYRDDLINNFKG